MREVDRYRVREMAHAAMLVFEGSAVPVPGGCRPNDKTATATRIANNPRAVRRETYTPRLLPLASYLHAAGLAMATQFRMLIMSGQPARNRSPCATPAIRLLRVRPAHRAPGLRRIRGTSVRSSRQQSQLQTAFACRTRFRWRGPQAKVPGRPQVPSS